MGAKGFMNLVEKEAIEKTNGMFAEFMGGKRYKMANTVYFVFSETKQPWVKDLKYHLSWGELMPVVEKIETIGFVVNIKEFDCEIYDGGDGKMEDNIFVSSNSKLEAVYQAITEFFKWYNQNKQL